MVNGIHHITAISGDPQKTVDFYSNFLGLRLVKKTVNFDDPYTYHLYFGNQTGDPGTIITFFPWGENALPGKRGMGQITTVAYSVPENGIDFWLKKFNEEGIPFTGPFNRFGDEVILFEDHYGIENELCFNSHDNRPGSNGSTVPEEFAIRGFAGATLTIEHQQKSSDLLTSILNYQLVNETANRFRYQQNSNSFIDLIIYPDAIPGRMGVGAVHHIAFSIENDAAQSELRNKLTESHFNVTPVIDRNYFKSIYFREPGNVLFEIATDPPGFMIDESKETLGTHLKLPHWYEKIRSEIEGRLQPLNVTDLNRK